MKTRYVLISLLGFMLLSIPIVAKDVTVGEFALKYVSAFNLKVSNAGEALRALKEKNLVREDVPIDSLMTEGLLADILRQAGINAITTRPADTVDENVVDSVISSLSGNVLSSTPATPAPQDPKSDDDQSNNNGKKRRPKGQEPNSRANPNAFYGREDEA